MLNYIFKVGDKGKTRDGRKYEVLAIFDRVDIEVDYRMIVKVEQHTQAYNVCGQQYSGSKSAVDLLFPIRKIKLMAFQGYDDKCCIRLVNEEDAKYYIDDDCYIRNENMDMEIEV